MSHFKKRGAPKQDEGKEPSKVAKECESVLGDQTSSYIAIQMKNLRLNTMLIEKPSSLFGCQGVNYSEIEEQSRKIYKKVWGVKKIPDQDDGPCYVSALSIVVEHLIRCFHIKKLKLSELDKQIVHLMTLSLQDLDDNIGKKDMVIIVHRLKSTMFQSLDFVDSINDYCNIYGSKEGEYDRYENDGDIAKEREMKYLKMLSGIRKS